MNSLLLSSDVSALRPRLAVLKLADAQLANAVYGAALMDAGISSIGITSIGFAPAHAFTATGLVLHTETATARVDIALCAFGMPPLLESALQAGLPAELLLALSATECAELLWSIEQLLSEPLALRSVTVGTARPTGPTQARDLIPDESSCAPVFGWWGNAAQGQSPAAFALSCPDRVSITAVSMALAPRRSAPSSSVLQNWPLDLAVVIDAGAATAAQIASLMTGQAVMLSSLPAAARPEAFASLQALYTLSGAAAPILANGRVRGHHFTLETAPPMNQLTNPIWPDAAHDSDGTDNPASAIEVQLGCELARLSMSLADIARLAPGMVVDLKAPLEGMRGTLRAGGRVVGHGEIVVLGDGLALRLTRVAATPASASASAPAAAPASALI